MVNIHLLILFAQRKKNQTSPPPLQVNYFSCCVCRRVSIRPYKPHGILLPVIYKKLLRKCIFEGVFVVVLVWAFFLLFFFSENVLHYEVFILYLSYSQFRNTNGRQDRSHFHSSSKLSRPHLASVEKDMCFSTWCV